MKHTPSPFKQDNKIENIFDEFSVSENLNEEIERIESTQSKDLYYYLKKGGKILFICNIFLLFFLLIGWLYLHIQNRDSGTIPNILSPICFIFVGDTRLIESECENINFLHQKYESEIEEEIAFQTQEILPLLEDTYTIENFNFSPRVKFLLNKSQNRGQVLSILSAFDEIKTEFSPTDKKEVSCYNISIDNQNILELRCDFYSSDWDTSITALEKNGSSTTSYSGTSISRASSFIDFLKNDTRGRFTLINSSDSLSSEDVQNGPYTSVTTIQLQLLYTGSYNSLF